LYKFICGFLPDADRHHDASRTEVFCQITPIGSRLN